MFKFIEKLKKLVDNTLPCVENDNGIDNSPLGAENDNDTDSAHVGVENVSDITVSDFIKVLFYLLSESLINKINTFCKKLPLALDWRQRKYFL